MSIVRVIIRWAVRVTFFFICMCPFNYGIDNAMIWVLVTELVTSGIALCRYSPDSLIKVIVGFDGDDDFGYYEYNDNFGMRATGWVFWLIAFGFKIAMLYFCYLQLFKGGLPV